MLRVMRDEHATKKRRDEMAKAAAPFVHSRISPMGSSGAAASGGILDLSKLTDDELDALERISRKIAGAFGDPSGATPA
jgi:hypothetical protein